MAKVSEMALQTRHPLIALLHSAARVVRKPKQPSGLLELEVVVARAEMAARSATVCLTRAPAVAPRTAADVNPPATATTCQVWTIAMSPSDDTTLRREAVLVLKARLVQEGRNLRMR